MKYSMLVLAAAVAACVQSANSPETADSAVITTGTYFGFCQGYCTSEMIVDGETLRLTETGRDPVQFPPRTRTLQLSAADRARFTALVDPAALAGLAGTHGCPDCADGGGEWIQYRAGPDSTRIIFEYGKTLEPIAALQAELRALRHRF